MAGLSGRYERALDDKGRVTLPAKLRSTLLESELHIAKSVDGCLALYASEEFARQAAEIQKLASGDREDRILARAWSSSVYEVEVDSQGRVAVPTELRAYAGLEPGGSVVVIGFGNWVEL